MDDNNDHQCIGADELLAQTKNNIEAYGLQVIAVSGTAYSPAFAYSIGLYKTYNHPEIICFGLPTDLAYDIINDVADLVKGAEKIEASKNYSNIFKESRAEFLAVDERNMYDYFAAAFNFYESEKFPALQLVWTDRNDLFPWEENFEEEFLYDQPLLDRNVAFKFREEKNLGIFTTMQWLELNKPILRVVHDVDGDWKFLTGDQMPQDIRLVALEQMIIRDHSLNQLFDLDYGQSAEREFIGGNWTRVMEKPDENAGN